jgi:hypothetical protein
MTERDLAYNICRCMASDIVDANGGVSMGGGSFSEAYANRRYKAGDKNVADIAECAGALRHWVSSVGYDEDGKFEIIMSDYKQ